MCSVTFDIIIILDVFFVFSLTCSFPRDLTFPAVTSHGGNLSNLVQLPVDAFVQLFFFYPTCAHIA